MIQINPTLRKKKKGTPVYSGVPFEPRLNESSMKRSLDKLDSKSALDQGVLALKKLWNLE